MSRKNSSDKTWVGDIIFLVGIFSMFALFGGEPDLMDAIIEHIKKD